MGKVLLEYQALDLAINERRDLVTLVRIQAGLPLFRFVPNVQRPARRTDRDPFEFPRKRALLLV